MSGFYDFPAGMRRYVTATTRTLLTLAAAIAAAVMVLAAQPAAAHASVSMKTPVPATFVPDWDGENDSTRIPVRLSQESVVSVNILKGTRIVRIVQRRTLMAPGNHSIWWDGRAGSGTAVAPGRYTVRVIARPVLSSAARAATTTPATGPAQQRHRAVNVAAARVSISNLRLQRGYLARRSAARSTSLSFRLSRAGKVAAGVVAPNGKVVRNLYRGSRRKGVSRVTWNGLDDRNRRVPDGLYRIAIAGSTGAFPTNTLMTPIRVDTVSPRVVPLRRKVRAKVRGNRLVVKLPVRLSEPSRVTISRRGVSKPSTWRADFNHGRRTTKFDARTLGVRGGTRPQRHRLRITARDAAGNTTTVYALVIVPAMAKPKPPAPPPRPAPPTPSQGAGTKLVWPAAGTFTSPFGPRNGRLHAGIDIGAPTGTPIVAAASGIVRFAGTQSGYGLITIIEHPGGFTTSYAHESRLVAVVGQTVSRGQLIGYVGNTGHSTGPHLHFELRVGGIAVDPVPHLPKGGPPGLR